MGAPQELYHNPTTRFVAGFIGSPAMNFIMVRVEESGNALSLKLSDGETLQVPPARVDRYGSYKDRKMLLGLRPEHLTEYRDNPKPGVARLEQRVDVTEPMGMETLVHFFIDAAPICARIDPGVRAEPGEVMPFAANMNHMHLIDPESGRVV